ncbi:hypothetical protein, partial [Pectinatus frisingensis]|uniref:hypothetical protein n=1 Tax=Pectinatus frisingensis TaxID=865 RepID=UPI001E57B6BA
DMVIFSFMLFGKKHIAMINLLCLTKYTQIVFDAFLRISIEKFLKIVLFAVQFFLSVEFFF